MVIAVDDDIACRNLEIQAHHELPPVAPVMVR